MGNTTTVDNQTELLKKQIQEQEEIICKLQSEIECHKISNNGQIDTCVLKQIKQIKKEHDYEYLIFSGGGIKGIVFAGALEILEKLDILYSNSNEFKIKGIAGTSAGSIIASLLAIGYTPKELINIMGDIDFKKVIDDKYGYIRDAVNFIEDWGLCPGDYIQGLLGDLIKQKTGNADYTIEDLMNDKGIKLVITTTDINYEKSVYFYAGNPISVYSNIPIRKAVRMSIGIPGIFEPYSYNDSYFVDGGVLDNYPLHVFDGEYPGDPKARLNLCQPNPKVLGMKLMTNDKEINYDITDKKNFDNLFSYFISFIDLFLTENDRRMMTPSFWVRTIIIVTPVYPINKFDITEPELESLLDIGKKYTSDFFKD